MSFSGHQPYNPTATALVRKPVTLANDGFFPDVVVDDFLAVERITDEYRDEVIHHALLLGMKSANSDLATRACAAMKAGWVTLTDIPSCELGNIHLLGLLYKDAVYAWAKCHLMREYATMNRKKEAENVGKESHERCPELLARYREAIGELLGQGSEFRAALL